jgi:hypothetical protein
MKPWKAVTAASVALLVIDGEGRADVASPIPNFSRNVQVRVQFHGLENYPEFDFYLQYGRSGGYAWPGMYLVPVASDVVQLLPGEGRRMSDVVLVVVPHGQEPIKPTADERDPRQFKKIPGEMRSQTLSGARNDEANAGFVLPYRVTIHDGIVEATAETAELLSLGEWLGVHPITVGFWLAVVIALVGWGFARWRWRSARAAGSGHAPLP